MNGTRYDRTKNKKKQTDVRCTYRTILHLLIFPVKSCDIFQWDGFKDKMLEMYTAQANKRSKPNMFARTHANTSVWIWMNYSSLCAWVSMWYRRQFDIPWWNFINSFSWNSDLLWSRLNPRSCYDYHDFLSLAVTVTKYIHTHTRVLIDGWKQLSLKFHWAALWQFRFFSLFSFFSCHTGWVQFVFSGWLTACTCVFKYFCFFSSANETTTYQIFISRARAIIITFHNYWLMWCTYNI